MRNDGKCALMAAAIAAAMTLGGTASAGERYDKTTQFDRQAQRYEQAE